MGAVGATMGSPAQSLAGRWITLPIGPTVNHYYDPSARGLGQRMLSSHAKVYRRVVYYELRALTKSPIRMIPPPLRVEVELCFPTKAKNDLDNRMKALLDALRLAGLFQDDSEIDELVVKRGPVMKNSKKDMKFYGGQCRINVTTIIQGESA